jgi:hypothetical protein
MDVQAERFPSDRRRNPSEETKQKRRLAIQEYWRLRKLQGANVKENVAANARAVERRIARQSKAAELAYLQNAQHTEKRGDGEVTPDQYEVLGMWENITPMQKRYCELRTQGLTPVRAVMAIDQEDGNHRGAAARHNAAETLEASTRLHQLALLGTQNMTEAKFQAWKRAQLERIVSHPPQNGGVILAAIKKLEEQREDARFGTREKLLETLRVCEERMKELGDLREWGAKHIESLRVEGAVAVTGNMTGLGGVGVQTPSR